MKQLFRQRIKGDHCSSMDRQLSNGPSNERHHLKPCPVPRIKHTSEFTTRPSLEVERGQADPEHKGSLDYEEISFKQEEGRVEEHSSITSEVTSQ